MYGRTKNIPFSAQEVAHQSMVGTTPGYLAYMAYGGQSISRADGTLKLRKVWEGVGASGEKQELFEGFYLFKMRYSEDVRLSGYGSGDTYMTPFWAVRARMAGRSALMRGTERVFPGGATRSRA